MLKKILILVGILILIGLGYGYYLYQKPAKTSVDSEAELVLSAEDLLAKSDPSAELTNKVIEVSGEITLMEPTEETLILILNEGIKCELKGKQNDVLEVGQKLRVIGQYSGFDEMMNEISLSRCKIVK